MELALLGTMTALVTAALVLTGLLVATRPEPKRVPIRLRANRRR